MFTHNRWSNCRKAGYLEGLRMATVLVLEDDPVIREILDRVLCETYDCHTADRAEQALEYLEIETYDVILTDISMPGLGGVEFLKRIRQDRPTTPVIVISGTAVEEDLLEMGAFAFFSKPFRLEEIEDAVVRAIANRHVLVDESAESQMVFPG
jgi:two-component system response regulator PilR (NtrC family)